MKRNAHPDDPERLYNQGKDADSHHMVGIAPSSLPGQGHESHAEQTAVNAEHKYPQVEVGHNLQWAQASFAPD